MIEIEICSREEAGAILCSPARRKDVVMLVSIGEPHDPAPAGFGNVTPRYRFLFADTNDEVIPWVFFLVLLLGILRLLGSIGRLVLVGLGLALGSSIILVLAAVTLAAKVDAFSS